MSHDDEPLSSPTGPAAFMRDTTKPLDAATFDLDAFLGGVRPTRRTVKLHERADLIGVMDELAVRIDSMPDDADTNDLVDELIDAFNKARDEFHAAVTFWTVEKRSSEWIKDRRQAYAKAHSITLNDDDDAAELSDGLALLVDQLVGQVVEVKDANGATVEQSVTFERLRSLYDANEGEFAKLAAAMRDANTAMAQSAKVLARDFSQRYSTSRSGATS